MRYLLITYVRKPNGQIDEMVTISKRTRNSDIQTCNVILDFQTKKIDKCVIEGKVVDGDWEKMCDYYKRVDPALIDQLQKANSDSTKV